MNDFDYDVLQKKRIASGARHMKRGSRSKRCSLPSDNLTPAQLKRRNGPVSTYKLDAPMGWYDFRAMPEDLQKQYLTYLIETYKATLPMLGDLFHVHYTTVMEVRNRLGVTATAKRVGNEERPARDAMWSAFCNGVVGGGDAYQGQPREPEKVETLPVRCPEELEDAALNPVEPDEETVEEPEAPEVKWLKPLGLAEMSATFTGHFSTEEFLGWLTKLPIPEADVRIKVEVSLG